MGGDSELEDEGVLREFGRGASAREAGAVLALIGVDISEDDDEEEPPAVVALPSVCGCPARRSEGGAIDSGSFGREGGVT